MNQETGEAKTSKENPRRHFEEGDRVLVPDGKQLYEARILECEKNEGHWEYYVHYQGWNKKWDEWLAAKLVLPDTAETRLRQQQKITELEELEKGKNKDKVSKNTEVKKDKKKREHKNDEADTSTKRRKTELPMADKDEDGEASRDGTSGPIKLVLPAALKKQLVHEWECITREGKLVPLPREPCVNVILEEYVRSKGARRDKVLQEVVTGVRTYFDKALKPVLLYKVERDQCEQALQDGTPCEIYGAEHLLRLFVKMPQLLTGYQLEKAAIEALQDHLGDIIRHLQRRQQSYFTNYQ
ncbi:hypothetical protein CYMTET_23111 [Cymbomonas tetramitiformis]|uniref:Chromo domain-containing protein n=1 Tax=Cymbomonas tetramitiformis TaxID=36881 RepID=A0AAE0G027_9CHLO|nr:hypothetical protein CYMTET_23111 [Cymbomonas tetramitiformis]